VDQHGRIVLAFPGRRNAMTLHVGLVRMQRVTVTLDDDLAGELDRFMAERGYRNRSEAIRDLTRAGMREAVEATGDGGPALGALVYVYDHEVRSLARRLTGIHHRHHDLSVATLHVHLDARQCLEVAVLKGDATDVRHLAEQVIAERGVRYGQLVLVPGESNTGSAPEQSDFSG
jgi:CopG family transcriptional regulator, nickel-responsive regulator